jgi:hypothetical protein
VPLTCVVVLEEDLGAADSDGFLEQEAATRLSRAVGRSTQHLQLPGTTALRQLRLVIRTTQQNATGQARGADAIKWPWRLPRRMSGGRCRILAGHLLDLSGGSSLT